MRIGLDKAGWKTVFANDIAEDKLKMYSDHFGECEEFLLGDIHKIDASQVPQVDLATASFPCTDLSLAGSRKGLAGKQSSAFWGFINVIEKMGDQKPGLILLENVTGFLSSHKGNDFRDALQALNRLGYGVDAFIINAFHFVPQSRLRLFVVGSLMPEAIALNKLPGILESELRPAALSDFIFCNPQIKWQIRDLPPLPRHSKELRDIVEDVHPDDPSWWNRERCEYLFNQMSDRHQKALAEMMCGTELSYGTVFRRVRNGRSMGELRTDGIAGCLRTPKGGSGRQILVAAGNGQFNVRLLNPRECARLMGADDFVLNVPLNQALFGFGDAVCVPVIEWIARNYLNPLHEKISQSPLRISA